MEDFFKAAIFTIGIPYGIMCLVLIWNVISPAIGKRRVRGSKPETPASHKSHE